MKSISSIVLVSLCLLAGNVRAVEFPHASVTDGVCVQVDPLWSSDADLAQLQAAGISTVRAGFEWSMIEREPGVYDWSGWDTFVSRCEAHNLRVFGILGGPNPLYGDVSDPTYYGSSDFQTHFRDFVWETTSRYAGKNYTWELWNEPNYGAFWPGNSAADYMALANLVLPVIRTGVAGYHGGVATDPTSTILAGPVASVANRNTYLSTCFNYGNTHPGQQGLLSMVDGISVHLYRDDVVGSPETAVPDYTANGTVTFGGVQMDGVRKLMNQYGGNNVSVVSGEWGYMSTDVGLQKQADYLQRMYLTNFSQSIPLTDWFMDVDNIIYFNWTFGLFSGTNGFYPHGNPKPAYYAMQAMTSNLKNCTFWDKWTPDGSEQWILRFYNNVNGEERMAVWTTGAAGVVTLPNQLGTTYLNGTPLYLGPVQHLDSGGTWSTATWSDSTNGAWVNARQASFNANTTIDVNTPVTVSGLQFAYGDHWYDSSNSTLTNTTGNGRLRIGLGGAAIHVPQSVFASTATINAPLVNENEDIPCNPAVCQVRKTGPGTLVLNARNTFTGSLLIAEGSVKANVTDALYGPVVTLLNSNSSGGLQFGSGTEFHLGGLAGDKSLNYGTRILDIGESGVSNDADGLGYSGVLTGSGAIRKYGAGTFLLSNPNNNLSGAIDVYGGTLAVSNNGALSGGTSAVALHGGGIDIRNCTLSRALTMDTTPITLANSAWNTTSTLASSLDMRADITIAPTGTLNVSGRLGSATTDTHTATKIGAGTLNLSGSADNGYLNLVVNQGIAQLSKASTESVHAANNVTVASGATVQYQGSGDRQVWNSITLNGGTVDFNGQSQTGTSMAITAAGSTIANTSANYSVYTPSSIAVSPISGFSVNVAANSILDIQSSIVCDTAGGSVWPTLHKTGAGNLMLEGSENNTDLTLFVEEGLVAFNRPSSPTVHTATAAAVSPGAKLQYATYGGDYQMDPGHWTQLWGGTLDLYGANQIGTNFSVTTAGSTLANGLANTNSVYTPNNFNYQQSFTVNTVGNLEINGGIVGTTDWPLLTKTGAGTLTLSGSDDNTYTTLFASEGTVKLNKTNSTWGLSAATAVGVFSGATVQYTGTGNYQVAPGNWIHLLGGTLDLNGRNQDGVAFSTISGYSGSTLANTAAGTTSAFAPTGAGLDSALTVNAVGNLSFNGNLAGSGTLTKLGGGTLYLNGANNSQWTGGTIVGGGNVQFASMPGGSATIRATSSGAIIVAGAHATVTDWINDSHLSPITTGALALAGNSNEAINLAATQFTTLSLGAVGNYTYSGTIAPNSNTYRFGGGGGTLTVTNALVNNGSTARSLAVNGNVTLTGNSTYTGGTTISGGVLRLSGSGRINSTSGITLNAGGTLLQDNTTTALNRSITFNGGTLGGTGTYTKPTSGGTLTVGNSSHLSPGDPTINGGHGLGLGTFTISGSGVWTLGMNSSTVLDYDFNTVSGVNYSDLLQLSSGTSRTLILDGTLNVSGSSIGLGTYTIISGATSITDMGLILPADGYMGHHWSYSINGGSVIITTAPEPGTIAILATALLSLAAYIWRKRK